MQIERGMIFRGKMNGREVKILSVDSIQVQYQDVKSMRVFMVGREMFEHLDISRVERMEE